MLRKKSSKILSLASLALIAQVLVACGHFNDVSDSKNSGDVVIEDNNEVVEDIFDSIATEGPILDAYEADFWGDSSKYPDKANGSKEEANYTGQGFVKNLDHGQASGIVFSNIQVSETGCYPLYVRYCTQCEGASFRVYVENASTSQSTFYGALNCISKTTWDHFADYAIGQTYINLEKNTNYNIIIKGGYQYAQIDYIQLGNLVGPSMIRYEAENYIESGVNYATSSLASNGHSAGSITSKAGVTFNDVDISSDGEYEILINQCTDMSVDNKPGLSLYIDGQHITDVCCIYQTGWGVFDDNPVNKVRHYFLKGQHTIRLVKIYEPGEDTEPGYVQKKYAELDYIDIKKAEYTKFEAEEGLTNATVYSNSTASFSGSGYVGDLNKAGLDYLSFDINAKLTGNYYLRIYYAIGQGVPAPAKITIANNDGNYTAAICDKVKDWGQFYSYVYSTSSIKLEEGKNTLTLFRKESYTQIDYIEISQFALAAKDGDLEYRRLEAEDANIMNACIKPSASASGGYYVGDLTDEYYVEFPVYVAKDGLYEFCYSYCSPIDNLSAICVSTGSYGRGDIPYINFFRENPVISPGWGQFNESTVVRYNASDSEDLAKVVVNLKAGFSYITVRPEADSKAFELDYIELGRRIGEYDVSGLGIDTFLHRGS